jgi:hypothetical protein
MNTDCFGYFEQFGAFLQWGLPVFTRHLPSNVRDCGTWQGPNRDPASVSAKLVEISRASEFITACSISIFWLSIDSS